VSRCNPDASVNQVAVHGKGLDCLHKAPRASACIVSCQPWDNLLQVACPKHVLGYRPLEPEQALSLALRIAVLRGNKQAMQFVRAVLAVLQRSCAVPSSVISFSSVFATAS
jgi:hypothetical protein